MTPIKFCDRALTHRDPQPIHYRILHIRADEDSRNEFPHCVKIA